jgi:hypothetical protein
MRKEKNTAIFEVVQEVQEKDRGENISCFDSGDLEKIFSYSPPPKA